MVERLKNNVESKLGRQIESRGDCQRLSDRINEELNQQLSYNTIRRVFGVQKGYQFSPRVSTLNILAQFIGYRSFEEFSKDSEWIQAWSLEVQMSGWIDRMDHDEIIYNLVLAWRKKENFLITYVSVLRELFLLKEIKLIDKILRNKNLELSRLSYSELLFIANSIGSVLRKIKLNETDFILLTLNTQFVKFILLAFVDYSALEGYYGKMSQKAEESGLKLKMDHLLFFRSISALRSLLSKKTFQPLNYHAIKKDALHPILIGRIASIDIAHKFQNSKDYNGILQDLITRINVSNYHRLNYIFELKTIALICRDFELMKWICSIQEMPISESYLLSHEQFFLIIQLFSAIHQEKSIEAKIIYSRLNKKEWTLSYYLFLEVYFLIAEYHLSNNFNQRKSLRSKYLSISSKLGYTLLDETYLLNYFETR